jgi:hypothetical protein
MHDQLRGNIRRFYAFRVLFNARFYYPVFAILFLDFGLSVEQFALLNTVWAATIVLFEVPSGALADALGRVVLLRLASWLMVLEMLLILLAPVGNTPVVFIFFMANRIVSGVAEAMASGADEALAYDSLQALGEESMWDRVLERVMRYQAIGFVLAMILGGMLYDQSLINGVLQKLGLGIRISPQFAVRLPVAATLVLACLLCLSTLRMVEPGRHIRREGEEGGKGFVAAWRIMLATGRKVATSPILLIVILTGVCHDSVIRLLLTLSSEYYRLISIPAKYYGLIGAMAAGMGLVLPAVGRIMVRRAGAGVNFGVVALVTLIALSGAARATPLYGVGFMLLMMAGFSLLGYLVSFYLNREADSHERATVLSFKGLAYNLGYGVLGLIYAGYCRFLATQTVDLDTDAVFAHALRGFPVWFGGTLLLLVIIALRVRRRA